MKVNISGRGVVPGMGVLAPVYGVEMSKDSILRFLNFQNFKLFEASSGALITRSNLEEFFKPKPAKPAKKTTRKTVAKKKEDPKPVVVEEAKPEPVEEKPVLVGVDVAQNNDVVVADVTEKEVAESFINDVAAVEDKLPESEESDKVTETENESLVVEETNPESTEEEEEKASVVEDSSKQNNPKKKYKKNRH